MKSPRAIPLGSLLASLLTSLTGCGGGALGQMDVGGPRPGADTGGLASALSAPIALGADVRPDLRFDVKGSVAMSTHLVSAREDILGVKNGLLHGSHEGTAPVLVALDSGTVVDFVHVTVKRASRIEVHAIDATGGDSGALTEPIDIALGESVHLVPFPYAEDQRLVGVSTATWTVEPPIATVLREGLPNRVRLLARKPGQATVKVAMLGGTSTLSLEVLP